MKKLLYKITAVFIKARSFLLGSTVTKIRVGRFDLYARRDHPIGRYLRERPSYGRNFVRIATAVMEKYSNLVVIDVGANIGDTAALVRSEVSCLVVCIEGDDLYFNLLERNIAGIGNVHIFKHFLGDRDEIVKSSGERSRGTLSMVQGVAHTEVFTITLDSFLKRNPEYTEKAKLLKVDTDGYDTKVIRGSMEYIKRIHPVIFFEFDHFLLSQAGENGLDTISQLKNIGYTRIMFYDNNGRFLLDADLGDKKLMKELYHYTYRKSGAFPYYDVCVFHEEDHDIAESIIASEMANQYAYTL